MNLADCFSDEFIDQLNTLNNGSKLNPQEKINDSIDIEHILSELNFNVKKDPNLSLSGRINKDTIYIDSSEPETRQRFSMAHELGHAMQNNRHADRRDDANDYNLTQRPDEVFANKFAAQLLMPSKLVRALVDKIITEKKLNNKKLSDTDIDTITTTLAKKLNVSDQAMMYRIKNLNIFVPVEG